MDSWFLQHVDLRLVALATVVSLAALAVLYFAWRQKRRRLRLVMLGWGLMLLSLWPWVEAAGADSGPAIGALVVMLGAIALIGSTAQWRSAGGRRAVHRAAPGPRASANFLDRRARVLRGTLRALVAGPLSLAAAFSMSLLAFALLPWSEADRLITMAGLALILGAGAMAWSAADPRLLRPTATLLAVTLICAPLLPLLG